MTLIDPSFGEDFDFGPAARRDDGGASAQPDGLKPGGKTHIIAGLAVAAWALFWLGALAGYSIAVFGSECS